jgi:hypothetical protein
MTSRSSRPGATLRRDLSLLVLATLTVTACGTEADDVSAEPAGSPPDPDRVAVRVLYTGGYTDALTNVSRLPIVTVYADGRVVREGPQIEIWPPPALPSLQLSRIDPERVAGLAHLAEEAGVGKDPDVGEPPIADAASTRFVVSTGSGTQTLEVYALDEGQETDVDGSALPGVSEEQREARRRLSELRQALVDLEATLGPEEVEDAGMYDAEAVAVFSSPYGEPPAEPDLVQQERAWPGPELPGTTGAADVGCLTATGPEAEAILEAAADTNQETPWTSGGSTWRVRIRPLLPDEASCEDVARNT